MKLFKYTSSGYFSGRFEKDIYEVEEKAKTYIYQGNRRFSKSDIGVAKREFNVIELLLLTDDDNLARELIANSWEEAKQKELEDYKEKIKGYDRALARLQEEPLM